jgi:hypothetical protein
MMLHVFHTRARTGGEFRPVHTLRTHQSNHTAYYDTFRRVCCRPVTFQLLLRLYITLTALALGLMCPLFGAGARGGADDGGTALQVGRSRVRFPMGLFTSSCRTMVLASTHPLTNEYHGYLLGVKAAGA